jgi:POT family proton-dependent oligopeptide transporter
MAEPATPAALRYPPQVKYIVGNEACERFSFYGMRSILVVYMIGYLYPAYADTEAKAWYHAFMMVTYLTPLVGGWLADRFFGRYPIILWVSLFYVGGHAALALWDTRTGFLVGLALIACGSGGIKPCVSAFVGDQFQPEQPLLLERVYGWFYWVINLGSFSAKLLIPWLLRTQGPRVAFAVPGALMALAALVFWAGTRHYVRAPPSGPKPHGFLRVVASALRQAGTHRAGEHWLDTARARHPAEAVEGARAVFRVVGVFAAVTIFWALFDQTGSSWVLQGKRLVPLPAVDLSGLGLGAFSVDAAQLQALNPVLVLAIIPLFTWVVFPALERRGVDLSPLRKMTAGMFLAVSSFAAAAVVQLLCDAGHGVSLGWQFPQYLLLTAAEVLVSVTGLEFSYTQAPRSMRSTIMSIWFLTVVLGNLLTFLVQFVKLSGAAYFAFFAVLMLAAAFAFRQVARRYRPAPPGAAG